MTPSGRSFQEKHDPGLNAVALCDGLEFGRAQFDERGENEHGDVDMTVAHAEPEQGHKVKQGREQVEEPPQQTGEMKASAVETSSIRVKKRLWRVDRYQRRRLQKASAVKGEVPECVIDEVGGVPTGSYEAADARGERERGETLDGICVAG